MCKYLVWGLIVVFNIGKLLLSVSYFSHEAASSVFLSWQTAFYASYKSFLMCQAERLRCRVNNILFCTHQTERSVQIPQPFLRFADDVPVVVVLHYIYDSLWVMTHRTRCYCYCTVIILIHTVAICCECSKASAKPRWTQKRALLQNDSLYWGKHTGGHKTHTIYTKGGANTMYNLTQTKARINRKSQWYTNTLATYMRLDCKACEYYSHYTQHTHDNHGLWAKLCF